MFEKKQIIKRRTIQIQISLQIKNYKRNIEYADLGIYIYQQKIFQKQKCNNNNCKTQNIYFLLRFVLIFKDKMIVKLA